MDMQMIDAVPLCIPHEAQSGVPVEGWGDYSYLFFALL
jgi:hypothetical protein